MLLLLLLLCIEVQNIQRRSRLRSVHKVQPREGAEEQAWGKWENASQTQSAADRSEFYGTGSLNAYYLEINQSGGGSASVNRERLKAKAGLGLPHVRLARNPALSKFFQLPKQTEVGPAASGLEPLVVGETLSNAQVGLAGWRSTDCAPFLTFPRASWCCSCWLLRARFPAVRGVLAGRFACGFGYV